ncbi:uncharacterized protein A4U43_C06F9410 [Asparagus officinalis]|uniref:Uncharacterized protein n=1 Tax=Asparagus officinalis TaxID=4686 RepID=A0A5P1EKN5_ASPOF|nr:uncharacterized protein A4U43_C06F9410 [Asparagus officinalis]
MSIHLRKYCNKITRARDRWRLTMALLQAKATDLEVALAMTVKIPMTSSFEGSRFGSVVFPVILEPPEFS